MEGGFFFSSGAQRRAWLNPPTEANDNSNKAIPTDVELISSLDTSSEEDVTVHDKSNVLLIGPTGSGNL